MHAGEIFLTPYDKDSYPVGAKISRAVRIGSHIRIIYEGRDPESGEKYEGVIELECRAGEQEISAEYTSSFPSKTPEKRKFRIVGRFFR